MRVSIDDVLWFLYLAGISLVTFLICYFIVNKFTSTDEVICLGGHYELRYKPELKITTNIFVCDSAKIIYK